jgi:hypothetical protein
LPVPAGDKQDAALHAEIPGWCQRIEAHGALNELNCLGRIADDKRLAAVAPPLICDARETLLLTPSFS